MLTRRALLLSACAAAALPGPAAAYRTLTYTPTLWDSIKAEQAAVILNFRARWSLTCQRKHELMVAALLDNPAYARLTIVDVDWDTYGPSQMTERLKVTRRSTLLVLKAGAEVARLENQPYARKVRALLDTALAA